MTPNKKHLKTEKEKKEEARLPKDTLKKRGENLYMPRVPIFNISLAKIIEPEPLALTWALVSQK